MLRLGTQKHKSHRLQKAWILGEKKKQNNRYNVVGSGANQDILKCLGMQKLTYLRVSVVLDKVGEIREDFPEEWKWAHSLKIISKYKWFTLIIEEKKM